MGRNRLKRLKFHSQLCVATLAIVLFAGYVRISGSILNALIAAAIALACCIVLKGTDVGIRSVKDLIRRNLPAVLVPALTVFRTQWGLKTVFMALLLGVVLLFVWSFLAKRWICHEVTPGWTLLIYDSEENLRRAVGETETAESSGGCNCQKQTGSDRKRRNLSLSRQTGYAFGAGSEQLHRFSRNRSSGAGISNPADGNLHGTWRRGAGILPGKRNSCIPAGRCRNKWNPPLSG